MIGCDPDIEVIEPPEVIESHLNLSELVVKLLKRIEGRRVADAMGMRARIRLAQPHKRHGRIDLSNADLEERVDYVAVATIVGSVRGRDFPQPADDVVTERRWQSVIVVNDPAPRDGVVQEKRGPG